METIACWDFSFCVCVSNGIHVPAKAFAPAEALSCMDYTAYSPGNAVTTLSHKRTFLGFLFFIQLVFTKLAGI